MRSFDEIRDNICPDLPAYHGSSLHEFSPATEDEIKRISMASPSSSCELHPVPTWLLKECLTKPYQYSQSTFIERFYSIITQACHSQTFVKKASLDPDILKNYRPIFNLSFVF